MGRPPNVKPAARGTSRRGFFTASGSAALALTAAPLLAHAAPERASSGVFRHGVASGDPLADRVILWTRVTPAAPAGAIVVDYEVALDPAFRDVVLRGATKTNPGRDYTVKVDPRGLKPATTYYYRFQALGGHSPVGRTRTLPVGPTKQLRFVVASCSNHAYGYFNAYRRIAERSDLDFVLHLGDYLYEYGAGQYGSVRTPEPPHEIVTLADYRQRHAQYKADADLQELHRQHPVIAVWDDHEITNDAWVDGAENHTEGGEGHWPERVARALQAYYEWMPVRVPDAGAPRQVQRAFACGDLVDLVALETRLTGRSEPLPADIPIPDLGMSGFVQGGLFTDPARTLLGAEQEAWLTDQLRGSTARWKFVGQQVMFAQLKLVGAPLAAGGGVFLNPDQWDGYQPARDRLYAVLKGDDKHPPVNDVVILTGDIHSSWAADLSQDPNNPDPATGGYDPATGTGSHAVEFVGTSITSPGMNDPTGLITGLARVQNPHFKHIDLNRRGYLLIDVTHERVVGEYWYVDTVEVPSNVQYPGPALEVRHGSNRLQPAAPTRARRGNRPAP